MSLMNQPPHLAVPDPPPTQPILWRSLRVKCSHTACLLAEKKHIAIVAQQSHNTVNTPAAASSQEHPLKWFSLSASLAAPGPGRVHFTTPRSVALVGALKLIIFNLKFHSNHDL